MFGQIVRSHRLQRELSQERLAEKASVSTNYVGMIERGERVATIEVAERLARAFGVSLSALIADVEREGKPTK